jgi:hypothetical protein
MRIENSTRATRLLRVREFTGKKEAPSPEKNTDDSPKSRFVAPYYFKDDDQAAIAELLNRAGLSDSEGRQLFITAAEYEVGAYRRILQDEPPPQPVPESKSKTKAEIELSALGRSAEHMLASLAQTHKTARKALGEWLSASDPFGREHGDRYFAQLQIELERIAAVCGQDDEKPEASAGPPVSEVAIKLIKQLVRIYNECLDVRVDADAPEVFVQILCIVRDSAEINLPCDTELIAGLLKEIT